MHLRSFLQFSTLLNHDKNELLKLAKKELRIIKKKCPEAGWSEMFLNRVQVFFQYAYQKQLNPVMPVLTNYDGDRIEMWKATYRCLDYNQVKAILDSIQEIEAETAAKAQKSVLYTWKKPYQGTAGPIIMDNIIIGQIALEKDKLTLEVNSASRLNLGKKLLQEACGSMLTHRLDSLIDLDAVMREVTQSPHARQGKKQETGIDPAVEAEIVGQMMQEYYTRWMDEPVPALNGKTPRQTAKTAAGREKVRQLLQSIEYDTTRMLNDRAPLDFNIIRHELGLD